MKNDSLPISAVDLFCGAGGMSHGFVREGISVNAGFDLDEACRYPFEVNNASRMILTDVADLMPDQVFALYPEGHLKILAGCAPCQPFSTYRQRNGRNDDRWGLLYHFARLAEGFRPEIVTMENVPNLTKHSVFHDFVIRLEACGYHVWYSIVSCPEYGVPQYRSRLVLLASIFGEAKLEPGLPDAKSWMTVFQAIGGLPQLKAGQTDKQDPLHKSQSLSPLNLLRIRASKPGGTWRDWPTRLRARCHLKQTGKSYMGVYGRMEWGKPAPTITTQCCNFGSGRFGHPEQHRAISLREAAILQSFPPEYRFVPAGEWPKITTLSVLIGNAVPVELGAAIARSIKDHLRSYSAGFPNRGQFLNSTYGGQGPKTPPASSDMVRRRMRATGQRDTAAEMAIRVALHKMGLRYRVHIAPVKGSRRVADIAFASKRLAVMVDGCFWHGCPLHGTQSKTNTEFWKKKIETNQKRDRDTDRKLREAGWTVLRIWEHEHPIHAAEEIARTLSKLEANFE